MTTYTFEELKKDVVEGRIDTVLACQVDMQGRLMGKRFQAEFFVESAYKETHSCNYLLATDLEMETVPGYASTSWASGYGDYTMRPDRDPLAVALAEHTYFSRESATGGRGVGGSGCGCK